MANTKITQLAVATSLDSNTQNTLLVIVDKSSGTPLTKHVELQKIDFTLDYTTDKANASFLQANAAFLKSNSAYNSQNTTGTYANSAFVHANSAYESQNVTGTYANAAFLVANTPSHVANSAATYANGAFVQANAAFNTANTGAISAGTYANSAFVKANAAFNQANISYLNAVTRLNVSYTSTDAYLFDQYIGNNPTLHFLPGQTVAFDLNYVDANPFMIRISAGGVNVSTRLVHVSPTGVVSFNDEAQGKNSGILYWKVPNDLTNQVYVYQNANHPSTMVGSIRLEPNASVVQNIANAAFVTANTPSHVANSASLYANGAFNQANAGLAIAVYASDFSNSAFIQANSSYDTANSSNTYVAANSSIWNGSAPITMQAAIDRLANAVYLLQSNTAIL